MNPGYTLTPPKTNPNAPSEWAKSVIESDQPRLDMIYLHGSGNSLDHWYSVAEQWKAAETLKQYAALVPENYTAVFTYPIPKREISDWYDGQWLPDADWSRKVEGLASRFEQDPSIVLPTLDPYVKPVVLPPGISTTGAQAQQQEIIGRLMKLQSDMAAIKARLGA